MMIKNTLIGVAGSAVVLAIDLFVVRWSGDSNGARAAVALVIFLLAFVITKRMSPEKPSKGAVLSDNEVGGSMSIETNNVSAPGSEKILSNNKTDGDFIVKAGKINS
ncbi:hypothetical protein [Sandarakinorhabdus sp. AAP62]|uniref:hypothetical protein n=1 Tax=Sandarakinorhabdus sp. AAP62 TaxID=1248916 RepID=UPI00187CAD8D|nr:hypothetical protein [Sandarakinorhabdus sp. AAP62]